jgi:membrane protease YdiL (CAAX protease family)
MPWLLVYQLAMLGTKSPVENAAAAWLRALVGAFGREGTFFLTLAVCLGLCALVLRRLGEATRERGVYGGMLLEGLAYGALLGTFAGALASSLPMERVVVGTLGGLHGAPAAVVTLHEGVRDLGLAVGAGIFEEFLFRGLLLGGMYALLRHGLGTDRVSAAVLSVLVSAYLFSDYHHWGPTGEPYDARVFAFRFYAGIALGVVYLARGLGIAAFAHGFYDVLVMLGD